MTGLSIGSVVAKFRADISEFQSGVAAVKRQLGGLRTTVNNAGTGVSGVFSAIGKGAGKLQKGFITLGDTVGGVGRAMFSLPSALLGVGLGALTVQTAQAGVQFKRLEETLDKVAENMGISKEKIKEMRDELQAANLFGKEQTETLLTFLQGGLAETTDMKKFTLMAKDFAAAVGVSSKNAVQDFTKAIGTLRPELLENYRIQFNLNEVYAEYAKGLGKNVSQMTGAEKRMALLNELYKQHGETVDGVYKSTYDTAGKSISSVMDAMSGLRDYLGLVFEPVIKEFAVLLRNQLQGAMEWLRENPEKIQQWGENIKTAAMRAFEGIKAFVAFLMEHKEIVIGILGAVAISIAAFVIGMIAAHATAILIFAAIAAVIAIFYKAWNENWFGIQDIMAKAWEWMKGVIEDIKKAWDLWGKYMWESAKASFMMVWNIIKFVVQLVTDIITVLILFFTGEWGAMWEAIKTGAQHALDNVVAIFGSAWEAIKNGIMGIYNFFVGKFEEMWGKAKEMAEKIRHAISSAFDKDKHNSPSIADKVNELKNFVEQNQFGFTPNIQPAAASTVNQTINANLGDGVDVEMLGQKMRFMMRSEY